MKLVITKKSEKVISNIVDILHYGVENADGQLGDYKLGILEGAGFIASCLMVQQLNFKDGIAASCVIDFVKLYDEPSKKKIKKRVRAFIKNECVLEGITKL